MAREIAPGITKKRGKLEFAGYTRVRVIQPKHDHLIICDGCGLRIANGSKFIGAARGRRLSFHNLDCMKRHYHDPEIQRQMRNDAEAAFSKAPKSIPFGDEKARRHDIDRRKGGVQIREEAVANGEKISRKAVFKRDGYRCHICKLPVDRTKKYPYPTAPTIDHIIAIINGGTHTWDNVACSHWMCNSKKRTKEYMTPGEHAGQVDRVARILRTDGVLPNYSSANSA